MKTIFVTGGAGFIGSALIRYIINNSVERVVNIDKLTYASSLVSIESVSHNPRYHFEQVDICASGQIQALFNHYQPDAIINSAAESHVDRSIDNPTTFIETNILGTYTLLMVARNYYEALPEPKKSQFRFLQISTDEVFGDLEKSSPPFNELSPYAPNSPYSASKASADHLVRAWHRTYGLPVLLTNCSNNYGYFQFPEKLIPLTILNALYGQPLRIYGQGDQIRDWLFVEDHARALYLVLTKGSVGESYAIGGGVQYTNLQVVEMISELLNGAKKAGKLTAYQAYIEKIDNFNTLIQFVDDRPGHDKRYAIDSSKIQRELGWKPLETFQSGLQKTVDWYLQNREWWQPLRERYTGQRLGKIK